MTENGSPADANDASAQAAHEFPTKLRVHALARALGLTSRQILDHLAELGHEARSPQSSVDRDVATAVSERVRAATPAAETPAPAPEPTPEPTPAPEPTQSVTESLFSAVADTSHAAVVAAPAAEEPSVPLFLAADLTADRAPRPVSTADADTGDSNPKAGADSKRATADDSGTDDNDNDTSDNDSDATDSDTNDSDSDNDANGRARRRRRGRRGRGRGRGDQNGADDTDNGDSDESVSSADGGDATDADTTSSADADDTDGQKNDGQKNDGQKNGAKSTRNRQNKSGADKGAGDKNTGDKNNNTTKGSKNTDQADDESGDAADQQDTDSADASDDADGGSSKRRRRRRRRKGGADGDEATSSDDPPNTVVHEREPRSKRARDEVQGISGSTRLEAKRQRRRDGRDAGRRRPPILSESEFLARREAVDRVMVVRERTRRHDQDGEDYTQVAVLEDGVLVEHFVTTENSSSMVGNIYLGRVQNVLPGMEAAFVDIGRGRNGVLYAGEVNWDAAGLDGGSRKIEQALKPGDNVLVQVSKDPVGHKGARLTTQISLAGRYLVYVPGGSSTGISRKLPDVERKRLKQILGKLLPDDAGVIIRTASEGVSAEELGADIERLENKWKNISEAVDDAKKGSGTGPKALYEEPDLLVRVVRDLFNEDFKKLVVEGDKAWTLVDTYVSAVAPDLMDRVERFEKAHADAPDSFVVHRIDEQLAKALDRKVWLPSGGTLIIEHTEAMTVIDVNTGKFTGSGGNLEETVTRNNLEAAEEIVRQMRLRDLGGMIIVDFIDMVLESNRDLVLRRLTESLARDRTRHQVSEVTSLGLVQMTRKRLGTGLLEAFSTTCTTCNGRGIIVHDNPVEIRPDDGSSRSEGSGSKRSRRTKNKKTEQQGGGGEQAKPAHNPSDHPMFRAMAHAHDHDEHAHDEIAPDVRATTATPEIDDDIEIVTITETAEPEQAEAPEQTGAPEQAGAPEQTGVAQQAEAAEPVTEEAPANATESAAPQPAAPQPAARRRRRAVRVSAPKTTVEPVVMTSSTVAAESPSRPLTTSGPTSSPSGTPEASTVAVRRRPRRRTAGRPAGPPAED